MGFPAKYVLVAILALMHIVALFAGFFAPYSYREQHRDFPLAPPSPIRMTDREGDWSFRPLVYPWKAASDGSFELATPVPLRFFVRGVSYHVLGLFETDLHLLGVDGSSPVFLLGTDALGRDHLSRLIYGGQVSLTAGILGAALALSLALVFGTVAGYCGGWCDAGIMRASDLFLSVPWIYLLLAARAFLPLEMEPRATFLLIIALLGALGWAAPVRLIRSVVLSSREREFVAAARSAGATHFQLLRRHVVPQTYGVLWTQAALLVPLYMLAEVTLSFVGLGMGEPFPSWGNMLASVQRAGILGAEPWLFVPAALMVVVGWLYHSLSVPTPSKAAPKLESRFREAAASPSERARSPVPLRPERR